MKKLGERGTEPAADAGAENKSLQVLSACHKELIVLENSAPLDLGAGCRRRRTERKAS
jgi:hypothetical protein